MDDESKTIPRIWAVGGGKGGVGKSAVASALAIALARSGFRTVAVDADFGSANLHTVLGVTESQWALRHFLEGEVETLDEITCGTRVPGLRLVSGSGSPVNTANLGHPLRQKLLRHLRRLDAQEVVLDLGPGSSFNVLDFFVSADLQVAVVTPEPTAIENTYYFIKSAWFRSLRPATQRPHVREALRFVLGETRNRLCLPPRDLIQAVRDVDGSAADALQSLADAFRPGLVVNRAASSTDRDLGARIAENCRSSLGANVRSLGGVQQDNAVVRAVARCEPALEIFPGSRFAEDVYALAERMLTSQPEEEEAPRRATRGRLRSALGLDRRSVARDRKLRTMAEVAAEA